MANGKSRDGNKQTFVGKSFCAKQQTTNKKQVVVGLHAHNVAETGT